MERFMNNKMSVLDIELDNNTAKEAMQKVMEYMKTEPLNIVEMINADVLVKSKENEPLKDNIAQSDLVLPGERSVLELAEITDRRKLKEADTQLFIKMLLRFFHKNHSRIFLLTESIEEQEHFTQYLKAYYSGIQIVGGECVPDDSSADDMILNNINGVETDCVMSMIPAPQQEAFVVRNRILLNTRMWLGFGKHTHLPQIDGKEKKPVRKFLVRRFLKREVEKDKQKKRKCIKV